MKEREPKYRQLSFVQIATMPPTNANHGFLLGLTGDGKIYYKILTADGFVNYWQPLAMGEKL